jgi:hypothetical protein
MPPGLEDGTNERETMNDQAILEKIAQHPKCRAVQLADWIDIALEDVQASLAGLIAVGDVSAEPGISPAGRPCQFYSLSDKLKASKAYQALAVRAIAADFASAHAHLNKTDRAIAFVRESGTASSYELHVVMGLKPEQHASGSLAPALADGRLAKDGKSWILGPAAKQEARAEEESGLPYHTGGIISAAVGSELIQDMVSAERLPMAVQVPTFLPQPASEKSPHRAQKKHPSAPGAGSAVAMPIYRCALWSDGILEVRRDGETVAEIPQAVGESIAAFLGRLVGEGAAA